MSRRVRLDAELVRRGLARSRDQAAALVGSGRVKVSGRTTVKAATQVAVDEPIALIGDDGAPAYVSRGGHKLAAALDTFGAVGLAVPGRSCLDAGASTGGFTDVLLRRGAAHVYCVDVGYGQLAWSLQTDERVTVVDRTNVRELDPGVLAAPVDICVADLSFISLRLVLPALVRCTSADGDLVPMVKPQFEVGRERLGQGGVVRDPAIRAAAVADVARTAYDEHALGVRGVVASPLPGPAGNVEYFLWLRHDAPPLDPRTLESAIEAGPS